MIRKLSSAISSLSTTPFASLPAAHHHPARIADNAHLAKSLAEVGVPVSLTDCIACDEPCSDSESESAGLVADMYLPNEETYKEAVEAAYGDLENLPQGFDVDWDSDLTGSGKGGKGRVVVVSTGKSDWDRDHTDDRSTLSYHINKQIQSVSFVDPPKEKSASLPSYITSSPFPPPSVVPSKPLSVPPSIYSSSLISQSDDPEDQTVLVFPDWKVVHEVENSSKGAKGLWNGVLDGALGRAGKLAEDDAGVGRRRSWVLPYRAVVLLCSHKRRDKRCHIAAPLLRSALHATLSKHSIEIDETGASLTHLSGPALEDFPGTTAERETEVGRRIAEIESVSGGEGGEVGIFNINHLGGHRYAGVMIILFPSGAYLSYGRVTPQEIPRVVEDTILRGRIVPGLLRNAVGVVRPKNGEKKCVGKEGQGFLGW